MELDKALQAGFETASRKIEQRGVCHRNARGRRNELVGNTANGALSRHIRPLRSQKRREVHVDASRHAMEVIGIQARQVEHNEV